MKALLHFAVFIGFMAVMIWAAFSASTLGNLVFWCPILYLALFRRPEKGARPIDELVRKLVGCIRRESPAD